MNRVSALILGMLFCLPPLAHAGPVSDLLRSEYRSTQPSFLHPQLTSPASNVTIRENAIVATVRGREVRLDIDRANRELRYTVEGQVWTASFDETGHVVELRDPQGNARPPLRIDADQARAAADAHRAAILRGDLQSLPKATAQECAEQLIVCNPYEDEGYWEGLFTPMFDALWGPYNDSSCSIAKGRCQSDCEDMYSVLVVACMGAPTPFGILMCQAGAFAAHAICQQRCVVNFPC